MDISNVPVDEFPDDEQIEADYQAAIATATPRPEPAEPVVDNRNGQAAPQRPAPVQQSEQRTAPTRQEPVSTVELSPEQIQTLLQQHRGNPAALAAALTQAQTPVVQPPAAQSPLGSRRDSDASTQIQFLPPDGAEPPVVDTDVDGVGITEETDTPNGVLVVPEVKTPPVLVVPPEKRLDRAAIDVASGFPIGPDGRPTHPVNPLGVQYIPQTAWQVMEDDLTLAVEEGRIDPATGKPLTAIAANRYFLGAQEKDRVRYKSEMDALINQAAEHQSEVAANLLMKQPPKALEGFSDMEKDSIIKVALDSANKAVLTAYRTGQLDNLEQLAHPQLVYQTALNFLSRHALAGSLVDLAGGTKTGKQGKPKPVVSAPARGNAGGGGGRTATYTNGDVKTFNGGTMTKAEFDRFNSDDFQFDN